MKFVFAAVSSWCNYSDSSSSQACDTSCSHFCHLCVKLQFNLWRLDLFIKARLSSFYYLSCSSVLIMCPQWLEERLRLPEKITSRFLSGKSVIFKELFDLFGHFFCFAFWPKVIQKSNNLLISEFGLGWPERLSHSPASTWKWFWAVCGLCLITLLWPAGRLWLTQKQVQFWFLSEKPRRRKVSKAHVKTAERHLFSFLTGSS